MLLATYFFDEVRGLNPRDKVKIDTMHKRQIIILIISCVASLALDSRGTQRQRHLVAFKCEEATDPRSAAIFEMPLLKYHVALWSAETVARTLKRVCCYRFRSDLSSNRDRERSVSERSEKFERLES